MLGCPPPTVHWDDARRGAPIRHAEPTTGVRSAGAASSGVPPPTTMSTARSLLLALALWPTVTAPLGGQATVREVKRTLTTYPFSDPDPVPRLGRIYPYFRWDGFSSTGTPREYTVVELENEHLKVSIFPEVGGKVWNAIDKATGRSMLYDNQVVKFRDVAMRGPWTSGGIEANYGVIGHTPNVATPVDWLTRTNADGSVSCIVGALDLLTRTQWRLEIRLSAGAAFFTTTSRWYNTSPLEQPYYTWMNTAIPVGDDLEFVYAGNRWLGHEGELGDWPVNRARDKAIRWYRENDFGGYKSYHVFGQYTDFFGAYWHDRDFGMVRYAPHDEKPGKKLWIWGLSRQGMIWEQLLTDRDGQYAEVQSGRLFNQTSEGSSRTPFKHRGFAPHTAEEWTEHWFPVRGLGGVVAASPYGALNVVPAPGGAILRLLGVQPVTDTLRVFDGARLVRERVVSLRAREMVVDTVILPSLANLRVQLGRGRLEYQADPAATALSRPVESPADFDWRSAYGEYVRGRELAHDREHVRAREAFEASLRRDQHFLPAIGELAALHLRAGRMEAAQAMARRGLALDTYDGQSNYVFGMASRALGHGADARDGLDLAAQDVRWRAAAWTELAKLYLAGGDAGRAQHYAARARTADALTLEARMVQAVAARVAGDADGWRQALDSITATDPLGHFGRVERWITSPDSAGARVVRAAIRNEMPDETLLELALWYHAVGRDADADLVLALGSPGAELLYWRAWLHERLGRGDARAWLDRARAASPRLVFPFRAETRPVLRWARAQGNAWQDDYYLALVLAHHGEAEAARPLLRGIGNAPAFAPFYATRALLDTATARDDWERAVALDSTEWRHARSLAEWLLRAGKPGEALALTTRYAARFASRTPVALVHARALLRAGRVRDAVAWLDRVEILPAEGAAEARILHREANLLLAVEQAGRRNRREAQRLVARAREWPERLGSGKPYAADVDERLEDWLSAAIDGRAPGALPPEEPTGVVRRVLRAWERLREGNPASP